jgi:hypothetical protein
VGCFTWPPLEVRGSGGVAPGQLPRSGADASRYDEAVQERHRRWRDSETYNTLHHDRARVSRIASVGTSQSSRNSINKLAWPQH